jgi:hypothetical protein
MNFNSCFDSSQIEPDSTCVVYTKDLVAIKVLEKMTARYFFFSYNFCYTVLDINVCFSFLLIWYNFFDAETGSKNLDMGQ